MIARCVGSWPWGGSGEKKVLVSGKDREGRAVEGVGLAALEAVDVGASRAALGDRQAQVADHVVEGPVLHHQHHDVVDVRQCPRREVPVCREALRGLRHEPVGRPAVVDGEVVALEADAFEHGVVAVDVVLVVCSAAEQQARHQRIDAVTWAIPGDGVRRAQPAEDVVADAVAYRSPRVEGAVGRQVYLHHLLAEDRVLVADEGDQVDGLAEKRPGVAVG